MDANDYYCGLIGGTGEAARALRAALVADGHVEEGFKHGHPVYTDRGVPVCLVKAAKNHVLLAFWDGQALHDLESRLLPTGSANMTSMKIASSDEVRTLPLTELIKAAVAHARKPGHTA